MKSFESKAAIGALAISLASAATPAQPGVRLTVEDSRGAAIAGAQVQDPSGTVLSKTDAQGQAVIDCRQPCTVRISAPGFGPQMLVVSSHATVHMDPAAAAEQVMVTAYRAPLSALESPATTRLLRTEELTTPAAVTLDGKLRQVPGVETFRRSSSLVANPTSQGISLRALGSTSASRTLVTEDDVPLNDPLGGWIHWNETPEVAIRSVEVVRGGASDLYGSSAIGGVVSILAARPEKSRAEVTGSYGGDGTYDGGVLGSTKNGPWGVLGAGGMIGSDGFIQEAGWQRGPVDVASNVHSQNWLGEVENARGTLRLFGRFSGLNEQRHNGTPYQWNATRLFRYGVGGDWRDGSNQALSVRLFGSDEQYKQTFSGLTNAPNPANPGCSFRCGETPTKYTFAPVNELGASAHWSAPPAQGVLLVAGAEARDVRVWDREQSFGSLPSIAQIDDHQQDTGLYAEAMWVRKGWAVTASARMDWFRNFDVRQLSWSGTAFTPGWTRPPELNQHLFDPRLGIARKMGDHWSVVASGFRAFRSPTPSELYRATQVGSKLTRPNDSLVSERASGWEIGVASQQRWGAARASWFDTQVNRPITALTLTPALLIRENLGQIESRGISIDYQAAPRSWLAIDGGYQYAHAAVSRGTEDLGNWIPEVARNMTTLDLRAAHPRLGTVAVMSRLSGRMYDDDANTSLLHGYFRLDAYASHRFGGRWELFAAAENLLDRTIEVSKTPTTTLDAGRVGRIGVRLKLGADAK